jgi:hypothetical protein
MKSVPLVKLNTSASSTMLQVPPGEKSMVSAASNVPVPVARLLVAFPVAVALASEHDSFRHVKDVN